MKNITRNSLMFLLLMIGSLLLAQSLERSDLEKFRIRNIGPAGMSGRITAIDVNLTNEEHILAGSASGGLWESKDGGVAWSPIFNDTTTQSIGAVKFNQRNPLEIWVGTGEGNPRNSHNSGRGVFKTTDGGLTWQCMGLEKTKLIHRIIVDPFDPQIVYVAALGSAWGPGEDRGLYKTTDGGKSWNKILYIDENTGICDLVIDPQNHRKLIAATWEYGRTPWTFNSGGPGSGIHVTFNGGETWKRITDDDGLPKGDLGRTGLAIAANKPHIVYALVEAKMNGLYKSTDGGLNWSLVSTKNIGNRPFYYNELYVDPSNENRLWNLYSYVSKSEDGGKTFETVLDYGKGVHPDHHAFWISPTDPEYMINGNDGGLNISRDGGHNWRFVTNLPVGQFYHINIDNDFPYNVYGGLQDNGSWIGPAYVLKAGGIRNADWREVLFGDGFDIMPDQRDNRYGWAMYQGGALSYYDSETGFAEYQKPVHPDTVPLRFNWNAALAQNPFHDCGIYYGSQFVHKSMDCGKTWEIISPDLTTNDSTKQRQDKSGGLTIDDTGAENYTTLLVIAPSPVDAQVIWAASDDGNLHITRDGGASWTKLNSRLPGLPANAWIPQIEVSVRNAGEAFVVVNNYRQNDWTPYTYHTKDYGATFRRIVGQKNVDGFVCSIVQDPVSPNLLFLGTDVGLYLSIDGGVNWIKWPNDGFPSVQVRDLKIQEREQDLVIGTFGRAIWVLDDIGPLREIATTSGSVLEQKFAAFDPPPAYLTEFRSVDGIRFTADAEYTGSNRWRGARFSVWNKPEKSATDSIAMADKPAEKKSKKKKTEETEEMDSPDETQSDSTKIDEEKSSKNKDRLVVTVMNTEGDTVRVYTRKIEDGFNRVSWDMRRTGVRFPSRSEAREDADDPAGRAVLPGTYTLHLAYNAHKDSITIDVKKDPRLVQTDADLAGRDAVQASFEKVVKTAADGFDALKKAKKAVDLVDKALVNAPDSVQKDVRKEGKELTKKITGLMELYMLPDDAKGYQDSDTKLTSVIGEANQYLNSSSGAPGANAMFAERNARNLLEDTLLKVNEFIDGPWKVYSEKVKAIEFDLLGTLESVELKQEGQD